MKEFKFTMNSIKNVKESLKEASEIKLGKARMELVKEEEVLIDLKEEVEFVLNIINDKPTGLYFLQREKYIRKLRLDIREQENKVSVAKEKVETCFSELTLAIKETKKMSKVCDKEYARWVLDFNRDEQKNNDEIATRLSFAKKLITV